MTIDTEQNKRNYRRIDELQQERVALERGLEKREITNSYTSLLEMGVRLREVKRLINREYILRSGL